MAQKKSGMTLRQFHAQGKRVQNAAARRKRRGDGTWGLFDELGAKTITEKNRLQEARHFAQLYDRRQLDQLCELGRFRVGLCRSGTLPCSSEWPIVRQRDRLAKRSAQQKWSVRRLELELRRIRPRRKYGGQRYMPPTSIDEALITAEQMAERWVRWVRVLRLAKKDAKQHSVKLSELPRPIRTRLMAMTREAELLSAAIAQQLKPIVARPRKRPRRK